MAAVTKYKTPGAGHSSTFSLGPGGWSVKSRSGQQGWLLRAEGGAAAGLSRLLEAASAVGGILPVSSHRCPCGGLSLPKFPLFIRILVIMVRPTLMSSFFLD